LDGLRQALVDRTLEMSLHAAIKAAARAAFTKATPYRPPRHDAKAKKAAADKRKVAVPAAAAAATATGTKAGH
jgi:ABC-type lipoprotein release transport system permease subunit